MDRREFIRITGGVSLVTALAPNYGFCKESYSDDGILIEASSFADPGGWVLDTQFYQQMGGCYLLAHGMGKPVENALTKLKIKNAGSYHVYVRTKNWCPGPWNAPGQFKIKFNGHYLKETFGTKEGWNWQYGGEVNLKQTKRWDRSHINVELEDQTGFEGRVDAIYLSPKKDPKLPNEVKEVVAWKDQLSGRNKLNVKEVDCDVLVVGGGISGCAAALAAEKEGLKVALIQDRPVFGGNASEEIRVHTIGIHGKGSELLKKIDTKHYPNGSARARGDQRKRENNLKSTSIGLYPNHCAVGLEKKGKKIMSVEARNSSTGIITRFRASQFIDCSGDGWLGFWSGCEYRYGRESHKEFGEKWDKFGELWSPEKADNKVMGTSVLWNSYTATKPTSFPEVPWAMPVAKSSNHTQGEWYWEYSNNDLHQIHDAEQIRDHVLRAIYGNFANAKKHPKNARQTLKWVAYVGGKRESRRIMGDYIFKMSDAVKKTKFHDLVVEEVRELDTHYQRKEKGDTADYLSTALFYKTHGRYYLPFRSLYAKDMDNLMLAGRCFSCSHIGLSGPRVMNTCGQMGIATGYAAALCKKYNLNPREIGKKHIAELQKMIGYEPVTKTISSSVKEG